MSSDLPSSSSQEMPDWFRGYMIDQRAYQAKQEQSQTQNHAELKVELKTHQTKQEQLEAQVQVLCNRIKSLEDQQGDNGAKPESVAARSQVPVTDAAEQPATSDVQPSNLRALEMTSSRIDALLYMV